MDICFASLRTNFRVPEGVKFDSPELLQSEVIRSVCNGHPVFLVKVNEKLIGPRKQPWSVGIAKLADVQLCKTEG